MSKNPIELYKQRLQDGEIDLDPVQEQALNALQELYGELPKQKTPGRFKLPGRKMRNTLKGVYLHGGVGRGKSMLMDLFYECLPENIPARRVHFHEFMIEVHDDLHKRRKDGNLGKGVDGALPALAKSIAERSRIICFDEFHVSDVADAMILGRLFTALFERGVIVIATSNREPDHLYERGLQRELFLPFIELLKTRMEIVHLDGDKDYRAQLLQIEGAYFWPLGSSTNEKMRSVFERLTDNTPPYIEEIEVKGRVIKIDTVAKGVAFLTFSQLCEQPHGAEDYLKIAQRYHSIFLEAIPKMAYDRRNEAKRLMTLIDVLYESGTKLIISADAPPDKLYYGHDHEFEFQRTISRLLEMQSDGYFAK